MALFCNEYRHQIDEKMRIRIPAKLKDMIGENPFIMRGPNKSLMVFNKDEAEKMLDNMFNNVGLGDAEGNRALRMITSSGFFAEEDKQGRIILPPKLISHAEIKKNVVSFGAHRRIEIWSEENWDAYSDISAEEFDKCLEMLDKSRKENK